MIDEVDIDGDGRIDYDGKLIIYLSLNYKQLIYNLKIIFFFRKNSLHRLKPKKSHSMK